MKASHVSQSMVFSIFVMFALWVVVALMAENHNPSWWPAMPVIGLIYCNLVVAMLLCTLAVFIGYLVNRKRTTSIGAGAIAGLLFALLAMFVAVMDAWHVTQPHAYGTHIDNPEAEALALSISNALIALGMAVWTRITSRSFRGITVGVVLVAFGLLLAVRPLKTAFSKTHDDDLKVVIHDVAALPDISGGQFKAIPYIRAASHLQEMGRVRACHALKWATMRYSQSQQLIVLCRMLFTKRGNSEFEGPLPGAARFLGGTDSKDWPLQPIELVDGIPFAIVDGYPDRPESSHSYLYDCMLHCDWSKNRFREPTMQQERASLAGLITSPKWKRPLEAREREYLSAQIE